RRGAETGDLGENDMRGTVQTVEYQGVYFKVTLDPVGGEEFIVIEPEATYFAHPIDTGDSVVASWRTDQVHLLEPDYAEGGNQPYGEGAEA
ncbi:MAG: TOBE domain-containing protein, partial [bacterium]|nr:TOBE domain-containing protein [bacterium]